MELEIYQCGICKSFYKRQTGPIIHGCLVIHPSGSCCHYMEPEVTMDKLDKIRKILKGEKNEC